MAAIPQIPVVNAGALYINGLQLSLNVAAPTLKVDVEAGAARNSTNVNDIVVSDRVTLTITASGAGGLDTGALAASTLYAVYVIGSSANQLGNGQPYSAYPGTVIMSTSFTTPVLPMGYDMFRRVGAIRTTAGSLVERFYQTGNGSSRHMWYGVAVPTAVTNGSSATYASVSTSGLLPAIKTDVDFLCVFTPTAAADKLNLSYSNTDAGGTSTGQAVASGDAAGVVVTTVLTCPQIASPGIFYKVTGSATAISVAGYVDQL